MTVREALERIAVALTEASEERYQEMQVWSQLAERWKRDGDLYGWNFHKGMEAGANWTDILYHRATRAIETLRQETAAAAGAPGALHDGDQRDAAGRRGLQRLHVLKCDCTLVRGVADPLCIEARVRVDKAFRGMDRRARESAGRSRTAAGGDHASTDRGPATRAIHRARLSGGMMMPRIIDLPGGYSLRREGIDGIWWVYWRGLNMALKIEPSLACGPGGSIDREVEDFGRAVGGVITGDCTRCGATVLPSDSACPHCGHARADAVRDGLRERLVANPEARAAYLTSPLMHAIVHAIMLARGDHEDPLATVGRVLATLAVIQEDWVAQAVRRLQEAPVITPTANEP